MPKLILTVTLNPSLDKTVIIRRFCAGQTFVASGSVLTAGGKGVNVSRALRHLRCKTCAIGLAGGHAGRILRQILDGEKMRQDFISIPVETRTNVTVLDFPRRRTRILEPGPKVRPADISRFKKLYRRWLKQSCFVVLSGRNAQGAPDSLYADLIRLAKEEDVPSILDTSGPPLKAGLKAGPFMIKPNLDEAQDALGLRLDTSPRMKKAVGQFHRLGAGMVVITMNRDGAIGSDQREMWHVRPPRIGVKNDVGCGDALLAGFLDAYLRRRPFREVLQWAVAAGTANARAPVPGQIRRDKLEKFFKAVSARRVE